MSQPKILYDLREHIKNLDAMKTWIDRVYYDPEFSTVFNRPVLSMLIQAAAFLRDNLNLLETKHKKKLEEG